MRTKPIRPVKICQVCAVDFTLKNFLRPLIDGMSSEGWRVLSVCSDGPHVARMRQAGYTIETISITRGINPFDAIHALFRLIKFFRQEQFDVVHVHTPVAAFIGRLAAWVSRVPLIVYTAHGFYFHDGMPAWKKSIFLTLERIGGFWTDLLFTQSQEDAKVAVEKKFLPKCQVMSIGNGVDKYRYSEVRLGSSRYEYRDDLGIPEKAYVIGFVGRHVREKGLVEFLEAVTILSERHAQLWVLMIGERLPSDHAPDIDEELSVAKKKIGRRLVLLGPRDDIPELLSAIDLFCLPSWREGMPRTIIEAMMMGRPVLATDIRGSREEVIHEETGLLVPTKSKESLIKNMKRFIENPGWGVALGAAGRKRAELLFDEDQIVALQVRRIREELLKLETNF